MLAVCRDLGIGFVRYSPLGRGLLTGRIRDLAALDADDWRRGLPRFEASNLEANNQVIDALEALARQKGVTPAQLALAWVLRQGDFIVPIPGARRIGHLEENTAAAEITLSRADLARIDEASAPSAVQGHRYTDAALSLVDG